MKSNLSCEDFFGYYLTSAPAEGQEQAYPLRTELDSTAVNQFESALNSIVHDIVDTHRHVISERVDTEGFERINMLYKKIRFDKESDEFLKDLSAYFGPGVIKAQETVECPAFQEPKFLEKKAKERDRESLNMILFFAHASNSVENNMELYAPFRDFTFTKDTISIDLRTIKDNNPYRHQLNENKDDAYYEEKVFINKILQAINQVHQNLISIDYVLDDKEQVTARIKLTPEKIQLIYDDLLTIRKVFNLAYKQKYLPQFFSQCAKTTNQDSQQTKEHSSPVEHLEKDVCKKRTLLV